LIQASKRKNEQKSIIGKNVVNIDHLDYLSHVLGYNDYII